MTRPWFVDHPEFVPEWDVYRDADGNAVTVPCDYGHYDGELSDEQLLAVHHATRVWREVCSREGSPQADGAFSEDGPIASWSAPNVAKSRLLGRMIHDGLPPTRTKPPIAWGGPEWSLLPGGDPFVKHESYDKVVTLNGRTPVPDGHYQKWIPAAFEISICGRCGSLVWDRGLHDGRCLNVGGSSEA